MAAAPIVPSYAAWRPPQWSKPSKVLVTVPAGALQPQPIGATDPATGMYTLTTSVTAATSYVFDAVLALEHDQTLTKTHHPVQTGASVSSHAYIEPAQVTMYVLMTDAAQQYASVAQSTAPFVQPWTGNSSKSVSAYQQMLTLQAARLPLTVTTRLRTYQNMLILKVSPREDDKTITGARFRIEFEQLFVANTQASPVSARPNDTQSTGLGAVNVQPPSNATTSQFQVPQASGSVPVDVPGAGTWSSVNINSLISLFPNGIL